MLKTGEWVSASAFKFGPNTFWWLLVNGVDEQPDRVLLGEDSLPRLWVDERAVREQIDELDRMYGSDGDADNNEIDEYEIEVFDLEELVKNTNYFLHVDSEYGIGAWNALDDFVPSISQPWGFEGGKVLERCYDKLFYSLNIEGSLPEGVMYRPSWSQEEVRKIHQLLSAGRTRIRAFLVQEGYLVDD